jgi:hypothetical protein
MPFVPLPVMDSMQPPFTFRGLHPSSFSSCLLETALYAPDLNDRVRALLRSLFRDVPGLFRFLVRSGGYLQGEGFNALLHVLLSTKQTPLQDLSTVFNPTGHVFRIEVPWYDNQDTTISPDVFAYKLACIQTFVFSQGFANLAELVRLGLPELDSYWSFCSGGITLVLDFVTATLEDRQNDGILLPLFIIGVNAKGYARLYLTGRRTRLAHLIRGYIAGVQANSFLVAAHAPLVNGIFFSRPGSVLCFNASKLFSQ